MSMKQINKNTRRAKIYKRYLIVSIIIGSIMVFVTGKEYIEKNNLEIDIEVDGGINLRTAPIVKKAGANILVAGTAILLAKDYEVIINELKE